jgi:hypothetical protein
MTRLRIRFSNAIVVATVVLAACTACGASRTLSAASLSRVVLQPRDLAGWSRFQADAGTRADTGFLGSSDRTGVWIARYRRGSGIVVSRVDLYRSAKAAHTVFDALKSRVAGTDVGLLATPKVGEERVGYAISSTAKLKSIFWRRANAIASLAVQGNAINPVDLASRADARLRAALR